MAIQQRLLPFVRVFSFCEAAHNFPLGTISKSLNLKKTLVSSSNPNGLIGKRCFNFPIRKCHSSSVLTIPNGNNSLYCVPNDTTPSAITTTALTEQDYTKHLYNNILESFPDGIQMAFAYGSGAVQQGVNNFNDMTQNMLDFILVVDKPRQWHQMNLMKHPGHYSFLKHFGPRVLAKIQDSYGAGVYFNTLVPMQGRMIKYGVISTARLITDLLDWESLYISGRLHKPVNLIIVPKDNSLLEALIVNIESAVHTALLLLPDLFTEERLYTTIASLSYSGDIRMAVAEDNDKIRKIVKPNILSFRRMYLPILMNQEHVVFWPEKGQLEQALTFESRHHHLTRLPCQVLQGLVKQKYQVGRVFPDMEEIIRLHAYDTECGSHVSESIKHIVKNSSTSQTMKGILTAGFFKSVRYGLSKVMKKIKSR